MMCFLTTQHSPRTGRIAKLPGWAWHHPFVHLHYQEMRGQDHREPAARPCHPGNPGQPGLERGSSGESVAVLELLAIRNSNCFDPEPIPGEMVLAQTVERQLMIEFSLSLFLLS